MLLTALCLAAACSGSDAAQMGIDAPDVSAASYRFTPLRALTLSPDTARVVVGKTAHLTTVFTLPSGRNVSASSVLSRVSFESEDNSIATISSSGDVTGVKSGQVVVHGYAAGRVGKAIVVVTTEAQPATPPSAPAPAPTDPTIPTVPVAPTPAAPVPNSPSSSEPLPRSGDRLLLDTRRSMQTATSLSSAWPGTSEMTSGFSFTTDMDGSGTHALRVDWKGYNGHCGDAGTMIISYLPKPYPTHFIVSWKMRMGRTQTGGGIGNIGAFQITNPLCSFNASRKMLLVLRDVPDMGGHGRLEYLWPGPAPVQPAVTSDNLNLRMGLLPGASFYPQNHVGETITQTLEIKAASSATAHDGVVRLWVNGVKVIENLQAPIGPEAMQRFQFPCTFNSPSQDQSEYFWDFTAWSPQG